jgi:putative membrane protein
MEPSFLALELVGLVGFAITVALVLRAKKLTEAFVFMAPVAVFAFAAEFLAQLISSGYYYGDGFLFYLPKLPLAILVTWAWFVYWGHRVAVEKLGLVNDIKIAAMTALPLVAIDFFILEPLAKIYGYWVWTPQGPWFGAPIANFIGWFMIIFLYVFSYGFVAKRTEDQRKRLLYNMLMVGPNLLIHIGILVLWTALGGR